MVIGNSADTSSERYEKEMVTVMSQKSAFETSMETFRAFINSDQFETLLRTVQTSDRRRASRRTRKKKSEETHTQLQSVRHGVRGRHPKLYQVTEKDRQLRRVSDPVKTVYTALAQKTEGVTIKAIQEELQMPYSTVWFSLKKLRLRNLLTVTDVPLPVAA